MLFLTVFLTSACIMAFEIVGARMLAPYLGTSIEVWAGLIATILAGMSVGYTWGGKIADRRPERDILGFIIFISGITIFISWFLKDLVPMLFLFSKISLTLMSFGCGIFLFIPTTILLGMVSPFAIKLSLNDLSKSANTAGKLFAIGTVGSLFGTIFASTWLIPSFGISNIIIGIGVLLIFLSFAISRQAKLFLRLIIFASFVIGIMYFKISHSTPNLLADIDTPYNRILIYEQKTRGETVRSIKTDPYGTQCASYIKGGVPTKDLVFDYLKNFDTAFHFVPNAKHILMLGGCNYSLPLHVLETKKGLQIDVVELDPGMTTIAQKYFGLSQNPNLNILEEDARTFISNQKETYDAIFVDVFNSHSAVPFQLTTKEAMENLLKMVSEDGVVYFNLIGGLEGETADLFAAQHTTLSRVFPHVYTFQVHKVSKEIPQNILVIASKKSLQDKFDSTYPGLKVMSALMVPNDEIKRGIILTDDFAPVEKLGAPIRAYDMSKI